MEEITIVNDEDRHGHPKGIANVHENGFADLLASIQQFVSWLPFFLEKT